MVTRRHHNARARRAGPASLSRLLWSASTIRSIARSLFKRLVIGRRGLELVFEIAERLLLMAVDSSGGAVTAVSPR
jgi:hypothetical protein